MHPDIEAMLKKLKPHSQTIIREYLNTQKQLDFDKKAANTAALKTKVKSEGKRISTLKETLSKFAESDLNEILDMIGKIKDPYNIAQAEAQQRERYGITGDADQSDEAKKHTRGQLPSTPTNGVKVKKEE